MITIYNSRYSNKKLVVGSFGILDFDENGEAGASEEMASALTDMKGFKVIRKDDEIKRQPIESELEEKQVATETPKEKLPKFDSKRMSKTWLEGFGKRVYGFDVDKRKSAATIYRILKRLEKGEQG